MEQSKEQVRWNLLQNAIHDYAETRVYADRAALHKEILASLPKEKEHDPECESYLLHRDDCMEGFGYNEALSDVRKAIDEVFSSKE